MRNATIHTIHLLAALVLCLAMPSCTDEPHVGGQGISVALDLSACPEAAISGVTISITADDGSYSTGRTFTDTKALAATLFRVPPGCYTVTATTPSGIGGKARTCVDAGDVRRVTIRMAEGGAEQPTLRLAVTLPGTDMPPYDGKTRSGEGPYTRRIVADMLTTDGGLRVMRRETVTDAAPGGTATIELPLDEGTYDVRLWSDYTAADGGLTPFYDAADLQQVTVNTPAYTACTDYKDAAYACAGGVAVSGGTTEKAVTLERPLAKYRIVTKDIGRYKELEGVPPLEELTVSVSYEGYFPSSFNVATGKPNDAVEGVGYTNTPVWQSDAEGYAELASDWVLVNGAESSVRLTIAITSDDGTVVSRTEGVSVPYRRGRLTTVGGDFLTSGYGGGGVDIDTGWGDDTFEVEF